MIKKYCFLQAGNYYACLIMDKNIDKSIKKHYREYLKQKNMEETKTFGE